MLPNLRQYAVAEQDGDVVYWLLYDSLADAVSAHGEADIFVAQFRLKGRYRRATKFVRMKRRKKRKAAKC